MVGGDANADGAARPRCGQGAGFADAFGHQHGFFQRGVGQHHHELFTPIAPQLVGAAQQGAGLGDKVDQHLVARLMAEGVVDPLEIVQIHDHQGHAAAMAAAALQLFFAGLLHVPARRGIGQCVMRDQMLEFGVQALGGHQHRADGEQQNAKHKAADKHQLKRRLVEYVLSQGPDEGGCQAHDLNQRHDHQHRQREAAGKGSNALPEHQMRVGAKQQPGQDVGQTKPDAIAGLHQREPQLGQHHGGNQQQPVAQLGRDAKEALATDINQIQRQGEHHPGDEDGEESGQLRAGTAERGAQKAKQQSNRPFTQPFDGAGVIALERVQNQ